MLRRLFGQQPTRRRSAARTRSTSRSQISRSASRQIVGTRAVINEVRVHKQTGIMYIYEFNPDTNRPGWLRYDTWVRGAWRDFPNQRAQETDLRPFDRAGLRLRPGTPTFVTMSFK